MSVEERDLLNELRAVRDEYAERYGDAYALQMRRPMLADALERLEKRAAPVGG